MFNRTRIAPTPSGYLHLGNVMSFLITTALARQNKAKILLRIDDLDQLRTKKKYIKDIFKTLQFLGIPWDEGPADVKDFERNWAQRHRLPLYTIALQKLQKEGHLFACNCSRRKIARISRDLSYPGHCLSANVYFAAQEVSWRIRTKVEEEVKLQQISGPDITTRLPSILQHFIVKKKDGLPAYQLTSLIDDVHFQVDAIVRGKDLIGSSTAQMLLAEKLGENQFKNTLFFHHPLITGHDQQKLSKSAGDTSIHQMRQQGITKEAIYLKISRLLDFPEPVSGFEEFVKAFDLKHLPKMNVRETSAKK